MQKKKWETVLSKLGIQWRFLNKICSLQEWYMDNISAVSLKYKVYVYEA